MKKVRAYSLDGNFVGIMDAQSITEETRYDYEFRCLDEDCGAKFHWVKGHTRNENTTEVAPTFARNRNTPHRDGCKYDYEVIASRNSEISFSKDGKYFLRVNFPMGGSWSDVSPRRGRLTRVQKQHAEGNTGKKSVASIDQAIKFLEEQFGSLDHPALEDLYLDYQGRSYAWKDVFVTHDNYSEIFNAAVNNEDVNPSIVATLMPHHQISDNGQGKKRFQCTYQNANIGGKTMRLAPVIVCGDDVLADQIKKGLKDPVVAVSRPFIPKSIQDKVLRGEWRGKAVPAYLYIVKDTQIASVDGQYWKEPGSGQMTFDFGADTSAPRGPVSRAHRPK